MKYTVEFDTPDTADFCAAALRDKISTLSSIKISDTGLVYTNHGLTSIPAFNATVNNPLYTYPIYNPMYDTMNIDLGVPTDYVSSRPKVEIICREEDAKTVSNIIVGYGGTNIRKS